MGLGVKKVAPNSTSSRLRAGLAVLLLCCMAPRLVSAQATGSGAQRGLQSEPDGSAPKTGKRYVLVIGINTYANWPRLNTAVSDAKGFANLLDARFGYESAFPPLTDKQATRDNIESLIDDDLRSKLKPDDDLVIFFAGHGTTRTDMVGDVKLQTGFLVPYEARAPGKEEHWSDYIKADEFLRMVSDLPARHILVILDSCHSGLALGGSFSPSRGDDRFIADMARHVSRTVITSAQGDQTAADRGPLPDHSLFTGLLIQGLETGKADNDGNGWVSAQHLGAYVQHEVGVADESNQTPAFGSFYRGDSGDLVLYAPNATPIPSSPAPQDSFLVLNSPLGAEIHIDEQAVGHSTGGLFRVKVQPGERMVEVFLPGYAPWKKSVLVDSGTQATVVASLVPLPAPAANPTAQAAQAIPTVDEEDKKQIQELLDRYAAGFDQKDVKLIQAVWPSIPKEQVKNIRDFLKDRKSVSMKLTMTNAVAAGKRITVDCSQTLQFDDPQTGKEKEQTNAITLYVVKRDAGWQIDFVPNF
jgi:hypothetical protein